MVHFDAFWITFTPTVIVTIMFMTSTVTFLSYTCSTVQQKVDLEIFVRTFPKGVSTPVTFPLNTGLVVG